MTIRTSAPGLLYSVFAQQHISPQASRDKHVAMRHSPAIGAT
jgi:hypothetical protein